MLWLAALLLFQQPALDLPNVSKNPHTGAADVVLGKKYYGGLCAGCHGPSGDGGKGTNLASAVLPRAQDDLALYRIIRYGLPDTEMPGHNRTPREIWQIAAYVRSLGRVATEQVPGSPARGAELVKGKAGCLQCHIVNGTGGHVGPSLDGIGRRRSATYLRIKLIEPAKELAGGFAIVQLTMQGGQKLSGVRMNEDTWSIQVRDMSNKLHSFWKHELADLKVEQKTLMPSYRDSLSPQELNDIVAYLTQMRGEL
jgi:putative heme-binding domain-containing protein